MRIMVVSLFFLAVWFTCSGGACEAPLIPQSSIYTSVTLTHAGFDFSEGTEPANWDTNDGHTTNWPAFPTIHETKSYSTYVWFEPFANTADANYVKDMGAVALSSVMQVPTQWDAGPGLTLEPLLVGHVYVIKCLDGYAKFLVKSIDATEFDWAVEVEYAFTAGTTFAE